ncbi:MAG: retropepsin-like domain-containing protein [Clostridia bacterium]|nr:retropepsin-like domain-containing protein [Clostridia bacterium]
MIILTILILLLVVYIIYVLHTNIVKNKVIPFSINKGMPVVSLWLQQKKFNFLIDSGATSSFLDEKVLDQIPLSVKNTKDKLKLVNGDKVSNLKSINQITLKKEYYLRNKKKWLTFRVQNVIVTKLDSVVDKDISGILGGDFLKYYDLQIDYKNKYIYNRFI